MAETPRDALRGSDPEGRDGACFEGLRKQAKRWLRALRAGDEAARARLAVSLPQHADPPVLREVQQALARERGFASWADLKADCEDAQTGSDSARRLVVFLEHACIFTPPRDFATKWRRAERIRVRHPEIARASIHAAVVCGEVDRVREMLASDPSAVTHKGGPQRWEPLLFACYGRLPNEQARSAGLEMVRLLLDAGAVPDTSFTTQDSWRLRFTALTGAMGQGEMGQPEHPQAEALARLLLARGASPNDGQGLYNTCLTGDDTRWLEILFEHGLSTRHPVNWHADPSDAPKSGVDPDLPVLDFLAASAAGLGQPRRLALLLERGANPDARSIHDGKTCYVRARMNGNPEMVAMLLRHGATEESLEGHDAFVAAVREGNRDEAERLVEAHPEFRAIANPLTEAARLGEAGVVRRLLELGVDPNAENQHGHRALHQACRHREMAEMLLASGADPRGRAFGGTACEWARHAGDMGMARFHAERSRSLLDACASGHAELVRALLAEDVRCIEERTPDGRTPLHLLPADPVLAEPIIDALLAAGADPLLASDSGKTALQALEEAGADEVADLLEATAAGD